MLLRRSGMAKHESWVDVRPRDASIALSGGSCWSLVKIHLLLAMAVVSLSISTESLAQPSPSDDRCKLMADAVKKKISASQSCTAVDDCINVWLGCPFG